MSYPHGIYFQHFCDCAYCRRRPKNNEWLAQLSTNLKLPAYERVVSMVSNGIMKLTSSELSLTPLTVLDLQFGPALI
ncbi:hypothetical protein ABIE27_004238 [Paenibacillus sp. 4624]